MEQSKTDLHASINTNRKNYTNFLTDKKEREKRQQERQRKREEEKVDIVSEMTGCSTTLAWILLKENNMDVWSTVKHIQQLNQDKN